MNKDIRDGRVVECARCHTTVCGAEPLPFYCNVPLADGGGFYKHDWIIIKQPEISHSGLKFSQPLPVFERLEQRDEQKQIIQACTEAREVK